MVDVEEVLARCSRISRSQSSISVRRAIANAELEKLITLHREQVGLYLDLIERANETRVGEEGRRELMADAELASAKAKDIERARRKLVASSSEKFERDAATDRRETIDQISRVAKMIGEIGHFDLVFDRTAYFSLGEGSAPEADVVDLTGLVLIAMDRYSLEHQRPERLSYRELVVEYQRITAEIRSPELGGERLASLRSRAEEIASEARQREGRMSER